jgi:hypothetical protein
MGYAQGNLTSHPAGLLAMKLGLPVGHFLAATNRNDVVPEYLQTGTYAPRPSVATKRTGSVSFTLDDAEGLAEAFGVPVTVFHMDHPEAREWIFANYGALRISGQNEYSVLIDLTDLGTSARVTAVAA